MNPDKIVCHCCEVTNGMIKDAVDNGADTLEAVQEATGAGSVCGRCQKDIETLIKAFISERDI